MLKYHLWKLSQAYSNRKHDYNMGAKIFSLSSQSANQLTDVTIKKVLESCPVAYIHGEESLLVDPECVEFLKSSGLSDLIPVVSLPTCAHHVWLDDPLAFVAATRGILRFVSFL